MNSIVELFLYLFALAFLAVGAYVLYACATLIISISSLDWSSVLCDHGLMPETDPVCDHDSP